MAYSGRILRVSFRDDPPAAVLTAVITAVASATADAPFDVATVGTTLHPSQVVVSDTLAPKSEPLPTNGNRA